MFYVKGFVRAQLWDRFFGRVRKGVEGHTRQKAGCAGHQEPWLDNMRSGNLSYSCGLTLYYNDVIYRILREGISVVEIYPRP